MTKACWLQKIISGGEIGVDAEKATEKLTRFIDSHRIQILNVAGPRKTEPVSLAEYVHQVIGDILKNRSDEGTPPKVVTGVTSDICSFWV